MYKSTVTKVLISLVAVIGVSAAGLAAVKVLNKKNTTPVGSSDEPVQTTGRQSVDPGTETNDLPGTQQNPGTEPANPGTEPYTPPTGPGSSSSGTVDPPDTQPGQKAPSNYKKTYTLRSDTGVSVNVILTVNATANADGTVHIKADALLEHYTLWLGARTLTVKIGSESFSQLTEKIADEYRKKHTTALGSFETDVLYGQKVDISLVFPYNGVYDDVEIKNITIDSSISIS
jgi:hypothetical protein